MGVRGLTTYIERNKDKYLIKYKLRDNYLVIDGNSLCANIYKQNWKSGKWNDEFGGDYDKFAKCIRDFFAMLTDCNIIPIVILDGGYEKKKIQTVNLRLQAKLQLIRQVNPTFNTITITAFPLFYRQVFQDVLIKLDIKITRCYYEADFEIAAIAKKLNCPVLSYDSDFFIFDALYIPFNTMDMYVSNENNEKYISCKIYDIRIFLKKNKIDKALLPLMATLLGNDYIRKSMFTAFFSQFKLVKKKGRSTQHRSIISLLEWLSKETFDSALHKILARLKSNQRRRIEVQIRKVTQGYVGAYSELFEYLQLDQHLFGKENKRVNDKSMEIVECLERKHEGEKRQLMDTENDHKNKKCKIENVDEQLISENESENFSDNESNSESDASEEKPKVKIDLTLDEFSSDILISSFFTKNVRNLSYPTLFIDILTLKMGFYQTQLENMNNIESFNIFLPILKAICRILLGKSQTFSYLGRDKINAKRYFFKVSSLQLPDYKNIERLKLKQCQFYFLQVLNISYQDLGKILQLPSDWQLFFIAVIFWARNAIVPKVTQCHLLTLILSVLYLKVVDEKVPYIRDKNYFLRKYEKKMNNMTDVPTVSTKNAPLSSEIQNVRPEDCFHFIDSLVPYFKMQEKTRSNKNLYFLEVVDGYSQFQSCLLHIIYLNSLLKFPFEKCDISNFYNGTFIYNVFVNLQRRNNVFVYIENILKNTPVLLQICKKILEILNTIVNLDVSTSVQKIRKRKKKKNQKNNVNDDEDNDNPKVKESDSDDNLFDENNKFSILALTE